MKLLSNPTSNQKLAKSSKLGYLTFGLSLAPTDVSGYNTCPHASKGCRQACIFYAGMGVMPSTMESRIRKTQQFFEDQDTFMSQLDADLRAAERLCARRKMKPAVRLNVFSDIAWEHTGIMEQFPPIQFYDYTKNVKRMLAFCAGELPSNYHLTFSRSESNDQHVDTVLAAGGNVAVVFADEIPPTYKGRQTYDGDAHDLRFMEPAGSVIGLAVKGRGRKDTSGFVLRNLKPTVV